MAGLTGVLVVVFGLRFTVGFAATVFLVVAILHP
jgi:hypothetical protein